MQKPWMNEDIQLVARNQYTAVSDIYARVYAACVARGEDNDASDFTASSAVVSFNELMTKKFDAPAM